MEVEGAGCELVWVLVAFGHCFDEELVCDFEAANWYVIFAPHVKSCACRGRFFLPGEVGLGFPPSVLVDILQTTLGPPSIVLVFVYIPPSWTKREKRGLSLFFLIYL